MKTYALPSFVLRAATLMALVCCVSGRAENATTNIVSKIRPPALVKSVFVSDPLVGKDPFFPNSTRRSDALELSHTNNAPPPPSQLFNQLTLKGISGAKGQRFALINSATVGVGEQAEIRSGLQIVKIICREIRDRSVLIELVGAGELKELKLRDGI